MQQLWEKNILPYIFSQLIHGWFSWIHRFRSHGNWWVSIHFNWSLMGEVGSKYHLMQMEWTWRTSHQEGICHVNEEQAQLWLIVMGLSNEVWVTPTDGGSPTSSQLEIRRIDEGHPVWKAKGLPPRFECPPKLWSLPRYLGNTLINSCVKFNYAVDRWLKAPTFSRRGTHQRYPSHAQMSQIWYMPHRGGPVQAMGVSRVHGMSQNLYEMLQDGIKSSSPWSCLIHSYCLEDFILVISWWVTHLLVGNAGGEGLVVWVKQLSRTTPGWLLDGRPENWEARNDRGGISWQWPINGNCVPEMGVVCPKSYTSGIQPGNALQPPKDGLP